MPDDDRIGDAAFVLKLIELVQTVLQDCDQPLTARQIYYRLVARGYLVTKEAQGDA